MKPPVTISIDRLVMPATFQGREADFTTALSDAIRQPLAGGVTPTDPVGRAACQTAAAIADQTGGHDTDG